MLTVLIILHILGVIVWLGGAIYERFILLPHIKKAKGTREEVKMLVAQYSGIPIFMTAVMTILFTGLALSIFYGYGFFTSFWLGVKQVNLLVIFVLSFFAPQLGKLNEEVKRLDAANMTVPNELSQKLDKSNHFLDVGHILVFINVILAVWKPSGL